MSQNRGVAFTVTGDNSGSELVLNIGGRYYVLTVNFSGTQTIEIPNGEVELYRSNTGYGYGESGNIGRFDYSNVGNFSLFLWNVPAEVSPNIQVCAIQAMHEDQRTGLVNPVLTLNGNSVAVAGTIPYNHYLTYSGGSTASEYDPNWNFVATLPVTGSTLTVGNGLNTFSVNATNSPNSWAGPTIWGSRTVLATTTRI